jgi:hypothetical protein
MRHGIIVVGSKAQFDETMPDIKLRNSEALRKTTWLANTSQRESSPLLDDIGSIFVRVALAPILAYRLYLLVHSTKLWSGKRPLVLLRGRSFSSRVAAYAGTWGGGDVVKVDQTDSAPLGPTRFVVSADGRLELCGGDKTP